jgi:FkbM family methyltransferase
MLLASLRHVRHRSPPWLSSTWTALGGIYRRAVAGRGLVVTQAIGPYGPFRLDATFAFSDLAGWGRGHNDGFVACVEACRGRRCVIDVGAHVGLVTLPVATVLAAGGTVVSFEPAAANRRLLARHLELNGLTDRVCIESEIVGAEEREEVAFFEFAGVSGMNSVVAQAGRRAYTAQRRRQVTLDAFCGRLGLAPEVIKIDVEGAEIGVLRGGREVLRRFRPLVFLSVHPRLIAELGQSPADLRAEVHAARYEIRDVQGAPVERFELREYVLSPRPSGIPAGVLRSSSSP